MIVVPSGKLSKLYYFSAYKYPERIFMLHWKIPQQQLTVYFIRHSLPPFLPCLVFSCVQTRYTVYQNTW